MLFRSSKFKNLLFSLIKPLYNKLVVEPKIKKQKAEELKQLEANKKAEEENRLAAVKKIEDIFTGLTKASPNRVREIMYHRKNQLAKNPKFEYLDNKLVEGAQEINSRKLIMGGKSSPLFYEPEICDVHNETLDSKTVGFNQLVMSENQEASKSLNLQANPNKIWKYFYFYQK